MIVKSSLDSYAATLDKIWAHDRSHTIGASEIGQCARKSFFLKNEHDPVYGVQRDADYTESWGARLRGTMFETHFWEPALRARFGARLLLAGEEQRTFFSDFLSATPDGMVVDLTAEEKAEIGTEADCVMVECKTIDPRTNLVEAKPENTYQTVVQIGLICEMTEYRPTHSVLSYTDASWWNDVKEFVVAFDPSVYEAAQERAMLIMTATRAGDLLPEGWIAGGKECLHCPFTRACGIERRNLPFQDIAAVDPQFKAEMSDMARELKAAEDARDHDEARVRELQNAIKTRLREKGVRRIPGVISWSNVKGRAGYDNKAIREAAIAAGVDVEQFKNQGEPTDRLVIQIGPS
ncbi:hypothetical protein [Bradyrhizobium neotropicale]|uniref:hypothetical protein n=1 Tax=Bradyrhizobium neotropicale TaxID=1497615 RepID=UPI001AD7D738|nr:hypothetical protein [Bradyrhizobium neotropicale]MBO4228151.1 hypothetical protein [Bradyrhizobium neotropicale]